MADNIQLKDEFVLGGEEECKVLQILQDENNRRKRIQNILYPSELKGY